MYSNFKVNMKKIILLLIFSIPLFASIEKAQLYYDKSQYKKTIKELKKSKKEYSNPKLHLLWAKSAEALKNYDEAMHAYERAVILDEKNIEIKIALIEIYKKTSRDDLANTLSKDLENYQLSTNQLKAIKNLKETGMHSFKYNAGLSLGYDTNINISPGELENIASTTDEVATMFSRFTGSVSYINELKEKGAWYAKGSLQLYNQNNLEEDAQLYDLFFSSIDVGVGYKKDDYSVYVPIMYESVNYLDKDLLTQVKFEPRGNYTLKNNLILNGYISYVSRSFLQSEDKGRDDNSYGLGGGVYYLFSKNYTYANFKYESYSKDDEDSFASYIDKTFFGANGGVNYNINSFLTTKFDYKFRIASYDDNGREDFYNQVELKLSYYFLNHFESYLSNRYISNGSNIELFEYNKNIFMLG